MSYVRLFMGTSRMNSGPPDEPWCDWSNTIFIEINEIFIDG